LSLSYVNACLCGVCNYLLGLQLPVGSATTCGVCNYLGLFLPSTSLSRLSASMSLVSLECVCIYDSLVCRHLCLSSVCIYVVTVNGGLCHVCFPLVLSVRRSLSSMSLSSMSLSSVSLSYLSLSTYATQYHRTKRCVCRYFSVMRLCLSRFKRSIFLSPTHTYSLSPHTYRGLLEASDEAVWRQVSSASLLAFVSHLSCRACRLLLSSLLQCLACVLHVCCMCVACVLHVCCMCVARVLHVCCSVIRTTYP